MNKDKRMARAAEILALYLDDLLLLAAGICFTAAGWEIAGRLVERLALPTDCCSIIKDPEAPLYWYQYNVDGVERIFHPRELSLLFFETYNGIWGRGLLDLARETVASDALAQRYGRKFYQNGARVSGIVEVDTDAKPETKDKVRRDGVPYGDWIRAQFVTGCPGDIVDYTMVEDTIRQAAADFELVTLGLDPAMSWTLSQRLMASTEDDGAGLEVIEIPQTMLGMSPATKKLELMLRKREMLHEHNTAARWCFDNVRCYTDTNENMKPTKKQSMGRIDYAVAWIIAVATAMVKMPKGPDINEHVMSEDWSL